MSNDVRDPCQPRAWRLGSTQPSTLILPSASEILSCSRSVIADIDAVGLKAGSQLVLAAVLASGAKMANDGIEAFAWHSQPAPMLSQPGLDRCDRCLSKPGYFRKLLLCVQR